MPASPGYWMPMMMPAQQQQQQQQPQQQPAPQQQQQHSQEPKGYFDVLPQQQTWPNYPRRDSNAGDRTPGASTGGIGQGVYDEIMKSGTGLGREEQPSESRESEQSRNGKEIAHSLSSSPVRSAEADGKPESR